MNRIKFSLVLVLLVGMIALPAGGRTKEKDFFALGERSGLPIDVTAGLSTTRNTRDGIEQQFSKKVRVQQGDLTLECDDLTMAYDEKAAKAGSASKTKGLPKDLQSLSGLKSIVASGHVKLVQNDRMATAEKAAFDNRKRTITLTGGPPKVWHGADVLEAPSIVIYLDENRVDMPKGSHVIINPGTIKDVGEQKP